MLAVPLTEPVHRCHDGLHFVPDDVAAHMKRLPINPFAMGLIRTPKLLVIRLQFLTAHQCWHNKFEPILSQKARGL